MTDLRKAAEMALEALESHTEIKHPQQRWYRDQAIDALRAALEQKPIEYYGHDGKHKIRIDPETGDVGIGS
jgi:hypothetical protein